MLTERAQGYTRAVTTALEQLQAETAVNAAVGGTAGGSYTAVEQAMLNDMKTLLNQIRAALIASGVSV
jgi:molybdenum-dependent DNA-binding transcriptional regulator ModE